MWADTFLPDQALPTMLALGIRVRCPDYDATFCLVLLRCLRSLFSRFNSSLILFLDARRNIFYSESVISCRLPDFLNIAVSKLVSIRDGLGACVADDFVWSVCASYIVSTSAAPFFFSFQQNTIDGCFVLAHVYFLDF